MKKILLMSIISIVSLSASAQVATLVKDTVYMKVLVGTPNKDLHDTILNNTSTAIPQVWAISNQTTLPAGFSVTSVCTQPYPTGLGQCVNYTFAAHAEDTLPASGGMDFKLSMKLAANTVPGTVAYVKVNSDLLSKQMVFAIEATAYPTSVANTNVLNNITLYPSPVTNILNVVHNSSAVSKALVFNVIGKKIMTYNTPFGEKGFSIPTSDLSNGIYFVELQDKNANKLALKKFIKN